MTEEKKVLEGQIRECYGRTVYTHKTQEKCADILLSQHSCFKWIQIILSGLLTAGLITNLAKLCILFKYQIYFDIITVILSTTLLIINSYLKNYDLDAIAQKHREAASDIWFIRERFLSLLVDLKLNNVSIEDICKQRDNLLKELSNIYKGAPSTNSKAYTEAQKALKEMEEMTFSDAEIDKFLPIELRRN